MTTTVQPHRAHSTHGLLYTTTKLTLDPPTAALFIDGEYVDAEGAATLEVPFHTPLTSHNSRSADCRQAHPTKHVARGFSCLVHNVATL